GIGVGEADHLVAPDDERTRDRQLPGTVAVSRGQVDAEAILVDRDQRLVESEDESEPTGDTVPAVAQHLESELVLLSGREGVVGQLRGDGDEASAEGGDLVEYALVGPQLQVAVRSPAAAREGEHDRA